jgi:hypothetical protein
VYPNDVFTIFDVGCDSIEGPILRFDLIPNVRAEYVQLAVRAPILAAKLSQECDPLSSI